MKFLGLLQLGLCAASEEPHAARVDVKQIASIPIDTWSGRVARAEGFARIQRESGGEGCEVGEESFQFTKICGGGPVERGAVLSLIHI